MKGPGISQSLTKRWFYNNTYLKLSELGMHFTEMLTIPLSFEQSLIIRDQQKWYHALRAAISATRGITVYILSLETRIYVCNRTIRVYIWLYMYTWSCFELWMWNNCPNHGSSRPISHLPSSKRYHTCTLKEEYPFSESDRGHFGNSFSALHHIPGCTRESPRKDFLNGLFVSQTTIAAKTAGKNGWISACTLKADESWGIDMDCNWWMEDGMWNQFIQCYNSQKTNRTSLTNIATQTIDWFNLSRKINSSTCSKSVGFKNCFAVHFCMAIIT